MPGGYSLATTPARWEWLQGGSRDLPDARHRGTPRDADEIVARLPDRRSGRAARRPLRPARGCRRSARHDACVRDRGTQARRGCDPAQPRARRSRPLPTAAGSSRPSRARSLAEHVVNAAGLWARRVGRMVGVDLPLTPMQHHYLITEDLPELLAREDEMPCVTDLEGFTYLQQERKGVTARRLRAQSAALEDRRRRVGLRHGIAARGHRPHQPGAADRLRALPVAARASASASGSTAHSRSRRTAIRWSGRFRACATSGRRAAAWAGFSQGGAIGSCSRRLDRRGRPGRRHLRHGRRALRRVREQRPLSARHHRAVLRATLRHRLPERGAAGRPARSR